MRYARVVLITILITAFGIQLVQADWETEDVSDPYDDLMITTTGGVFQLSPWVQVKSGGTDLFNYYAFRGISLPNNSIIDQAYLEFTAPFPWNYNQSLPVTIYGLKEGDLTTWNPAPPLNSYPQTTNYTNWDTFNLISGNSMNVSVTGIVQEIYDQFLWYDGNDMGFRILSVAQSGGERYQVAYDSDPSKAVKLYIEYSQGTGNTTYYKGYKIDPILSTSNNTIFKWRDLTNGQMRMTTAQGTDYETHSVDPLGNWTNQFEVDGTCAVGTDIYTIVNNPNANWNLTLFRTSDRGATWVNVGEIGTAFSLSASYACALTYDQNNTIHIFFDEGYDTQWRMFKIHNQSMTAQVEIYDGGFNNGQTRAWWDTSLDTVWFTRYGGDPTGSARHPTIGRRSDATGVWDVWKNTISDYRASDVINAGGTMYWAIHQYGAGGASQWLRLYELTNYSDLTSWNSLGIFDAGGYMVAHNFDLGVWNGDPIASIETTISGDEFIKSYSWSGVAMVHEGTFNLTSHKPASQPEFHFPKMYFNQAGNMRMSIWIEQDSGWSLVDHALGFYFGTEFPPPSSVQKATGHTVTSNGGDMRPFSSGQTGGWNVTTPPNKPPPNPTCLSLAVTLEDVQACIDDVLNDTDPFNPDPPASNYPEHEYFGRFDIKYYLWIIGQTLIIAPCIAIAYRKFPLVYYPMFAIVILTGLGLLWSLSGM